MQLIVVGVVIGSHVKSTISRDLKVLLLPGDFSSGAGKFAVNGNTFIVVLLLAEFRRTVMVAITALVICPPVTCG